MPNERENQRLRDQQKRDAITDRTVIGTLLSTREGRRWLFLQMSSGDVFSSTFALGPDGDRVTAFKEGRRANALELMNRVMLAGPAAFTLMLEESNRITQESRDHVGNERDTSGVIYTGGDSVADTEPEPSAD